MRRTLSSVERLDGLLRMIESAKHISVADICDQFQVSEATARRDLELLSKQGRVQRVHGGAISTAKIPTPPENPVSQRMSNQSEFKMRIGAAAAALVHSGETIFLGSGTTALEVARSLDRTKDVTVITNSVLIINELLDASNITLVDLGGLVRRSELSMIGHITEEAIADLNADKVIMGIHGIDIVQGLTNHYLPETMTDRKILKLSKNIVVVVDHTKCGRVSTAHVAPISVVDTVVTDTEAPQEFVEALKEMGISVIQA